MKKILLTCFIAAGISANAQISIVNDFEPTSDYTGWYVSRSNTTHVTSASNFNGGGIQCSGDRFFGFYFSTTQAASAGTYGELYVLAGDQSQTSNGEKITIKFYPKHYATANSTYSTYYTVDGGTSWVALTGAGATGNSPSTCNEVTVEIPAGTIPNGNTQFGFKLRTTKIAASPAGYGLFDNVRIVQATLTPPICTSVTAPANEANSVSVRPTITWGTSNGATAYKLSVGTTAGGTDIVNNISVTGTSYTLSAAQVLQGNSTYYVSVTATNENGDATGCTGSTFTTGANNSTPYCGPVLTGAVDPISNVEFGGINNPSDNSSNGSPSHEFFLNNKASIERTRSYPMTIKGNVGGQYTDAVTVFIDWNQDGDFEDTNEAYFTNSNFLLIRQSATGTTTQSTSNTVNITVPNDAKLGETRMRIKKSFIGNSTVTATTALLTSAGLNNPCLDQSYGQIEDYIVEVKEFLAASDITKSGNISVYPNPFTDVLNISDVKGVKSVSVNDVSGREVKSLAPSAELKLSNLKAGLYIVNLKMEDGSVKTFKAIKK